MIKVNVITNNYDWFNYIKSPNNYIDRKIKKLNLRNKKYSKIATCITSVLLNAVPTTKFENLKRYNKTKVNII